MLIATRLSIFAVSVFGLFAPLSIFVSAISVPMLRSASLSISSYGIFVPMPRLSAFLSLLFLFGMSMPVLGLSALPSIFDVSVSKPKSLASLSMFGMFVPVPEFSVPSFISGLFASRFLSDVSISVSRLSAPPSPSAMPMLAFELSFLLILI